MGLLNGKMKKTFLSRLQSRKEN